MGTRMDTLFPAGNLADFLAAGDASQRLLGAFQSAASERWITRADLCGLAMHLSQQAGFEALAAGTRVGVAAENSPEYVAACLAAWHAGLVAVPINHKLPDVMVAHAVADAGCACLFLDTTPRRNLDLTQWNLRELPGPSGPERSGAMRWAGERARSGGRDEALVLYTSGSTGMPKGVPLTHAGMLWAISKYESLRPAVAGQTIVIAAPLFHMNALFSTLLLLHLGARVALQPRFEVAEYVRAVSRHRCPMLTMVPTMLAMIAREPGLLRESDLSCVSVVLAGSAPLTDKVLAMAREVFPRAQILNTWGTTEVGPACFGPHPRGLPRPGLSVGYPIGDVEVRLTGGATSDEGVLEVRTPAVMSGYLNRPADTARRLRDGWYDTGDIMKRDAEGFYYFVGRADDMFVCSGENLYPGEIEERIESHPEVAQAAVVAVPDELRGAIPVAFVVPKPRAELSEDAVKRFTLERGPVHAYPRKVFVVPALPLGGSNKVDRASLRATACAELGLEA